MAQENTKLLLWATVGKSYRLAWANYGYYLKIVRTWLVISMPLLAADYWLSLPILREITCTDPSSEKIHQDPHTILSEMFHSLLSLIPSSYLLLLITASIAVAWHRLILRKEKTTRTFYLRLDKFVWSYFGIGVLLAVTAYVPFLFIALAEQGHSAVWIGVLISYIAMALLLVRMTVMLPAKALGLSDVSVKDVWQKTSWNFWRLLSGYFLCYLPMFLVTWTVQMSPLQKTVCASDLTFTAFLISQYALKLLVVLPICLSFLSLAFGYFFEDKIGGNEANTSAPKGQWDRS